MASANLIPQQPVCLLTLIVLHHMLVLKENQVLCMCSDLSNASHIVHHSFRLRKYSHFWLSCGYIDWLHSYLVNKQALLRISGILSLLYLWSLKFLKVPLYASYYLMLIYEVCDSTANNKHFFCWWVKDCSIKNDDDWKLLQYNIQCKICLDKVMKLKLSKTKIFFYS